MNKITYVLMFCLIFNLSFSIGYIEDANKLKDLTNSIVGNISNTEWEASVEAARKIYYWTKNNIQYDYEKDQKILKGKNFTIRSPYQTFLDRKGNSFEIALLDYILLYDTGLFNLSNLDQEDDYAKGVFDDDIKYIEIDKDFKSIDKENNTLIKRLSVKKYLVSGFLHSFIEKMDTMCSELKDEYDKENCLEIKKELLNLSKTLKRKRNLFYGTIIFNGTKKIKAVIAFDTYLEPYCVKYSFPFISGDDNKLVIPISVGCGNSKTLMILDPEYGVYTLPNYVMFLERKYNKSAKYLVLYKLYMGSGKFNQIYLISFSYKSFYLPFIVDYNKITFDLWWKLYRINRLVWPPYDRLPQIWRTIKTFYPYPYNQLNETYIKQMEEKYGFKI